MGDQHARAHVEVLQHRGHVPSHRLRTDTTRTDRRATVTTLVKSDDLVAAGQQRVPHDVPFQERDTVTVRKHDRRPVPRHQRPQHGSVRAANEDLLAFGLAPQPVAWERVRIAFNSCDGGLCCPPGRRTNRAGDHGASDQPSSHHTSLPMLSGDCALDATWDKATAPCTLVPVRHRRAPS